MTKTNSLIGRVLTMAIEDNATPVQEMRDNIRKRVLKLERANYAQKPDGLKDKEMIDRIKKIIESEVGK